MHTKTANNKLFPYNSDAWCCGGKRAGTYGHKTPTFLLASSVCTIRFLYINVQHTCRQNVKNAKDFKAFKQDTRIIAAMRNCS